MLRHINFISKALSFSAHTSRFHSLPSRQLIIYLEYLPADWIAVKTGFPLPLPQGPPHRDLPASLAHPDLLH